MVKSVEHFRALRYQTIKRRARLSESKREAAIKINSSHFFIFIILCGAGLIWGTHLYVKNQLPRIEEARHDALPRGRKLIAELGTFPPAQKHGELNEYETSPGKGMWRGVKDRIVWEQEFQAPGTKDEMQRWYFTKLSEAGWLIWDPSAKSELQTQWCMPPWLLTIQHNVVFDNPPSHRFVLVLEWMWRFTADRCPLQ
ncbi:MAG: hypothetical protein J5J00_05490 [Deltaproteobacteria bacterium]|nr:hypothetical protein [Deltaproteobacteria bacterium]